MEPEGIRGIRGRSARRAMARAESHMAHDTRVHMPATLQPLPAFEGSRVSQFAILPCAAKPSASGDECVVWCGVVGVVV